MKQTVSSFLRKKSVVTERKIESVGERVLFRRTEISMSQEELGKRLGVSQQAIHKLEAGITQKMRDMAKMAEILGVRVEWLLYGEEPMCDAPTLELDAFDTAVRRVYVVTRQMAPDIGADDFCKLVRTIYEQIKQAPRNANDTDSVIRGILSFRELQQNTSAGSEEGAN